MSVLKSIAMCARYACGFVLLLGAATILNIGIVLGWSYLSPQSFNNSLATAVNAIGPNSGDVARDNVVESDTLQTASTDESF